MQKLKRFHAKFGNSDQTFVIFLLSVFVGIESEPRTTNPVLAFNAHKNWKIENDTL